MVADKVQLAEQAQRHISQHMMRLDTLHAQFEKELAKADPDGLAEALMVSSVSYVSLWVRDMHLHRRLPGKRSNLLSARKFLVVAKRGKSCMEDVNVLCAPYSGVIWWGNGLQSSMMMRINLAWCALGSVDTDIAG